MPLSGNKLKMVDTSMMHKFILESLLLWMDIILAHATLNKFSKQRNFFAHSSQIIICEDLCAKVLHFNHWKDQNQAGIIQKSSQKKRVAKPQAKQTESHGSELKRLGKNGKTSQRHNILNQ